MLRSPQRLQSRAPGRRPGCIPPAAVKGKTVPPASSPVVVPVTVDQSDIKEQLRQLKKAQQRTADILQDIKRTAAAAKWQTTVQTLQWAISNTHLNSFTYYDSDEGSTQYTSDDLVRWILLTFMEGDGYWIDDSYYIDDQPSPYYSDGPSDEQQEEFRDELECQIHQLTGVRPRFELEENDEGDEQWCVYRE